LIYRICICATDGIVKAEAFFDGHSFDFGILGMEEWWKFLYELMECDWGRFFVSGGGVTVDGC
jgi:hypothetical protein